MREIPRLGVMNGPFPRRLESEMTDSRNTHENPVESPVANPVEKPALPVEARQAGAHTRVSAGRAASRPESTKAQLPKGTSALRSPARRASDDIRWSISQRMTDRDRSVIRDLKRFRVLTTPQLARLHFNSFKRASARLLFLHELKVLDRFRPIREHWGAHPWHWVVGPMGAAILAGERGEDPERASRRWRGERMLAYATGQRLAHLVGINDLYVSLAAHARRNETCLLDWLTESEAVEWTHGIVRPDAWGTWEDDGRRVEFFVEYDRGTETLGRLVDKLDGYERFEAERGAIAWVLFAFTSGRREQTARRALTAATVPVATTWHPDPHDAVWLPLSAAGDRMRLAALADVPKPPEAVERASNTMRAWRYER